MTIIDPNHLALLRVHDACRGLTKEEIDAIASDSEVVHAEAGDLIYSVGRDPDSLSIVVEGRLKIVTKAFDGQQRTIRYVSAGDQFGALTLVTNDKFPVDVVVDETAVLLRLTKDDAIRLVDQFPTFRRNLLRKIGLGVLDAMHRRRSRTPPKIVTYFHADENSRKLVAEIASRLIRIGEKVGILDDSTNRTPYEEGVRFKSLRNAKGDYLAREDVRSIIAGWTDLDRIFLALDQSMPTEDVDRLVALSDSVFCFSRTDHFDPAVRALKRLWNQSPSVLKKTHIVWLMADDEQVAPLVPELFTMTKRDFKVQFPYCQSTPRLFSQGIDRIVHFLRDVHIGLALSGGAAHGMAHLGVLRAFEAAGITIDRIAGTSAGVLTGVLYCAGYTAQWGVERFTRDLEPSPFYKWLPKGDGLYLLERYRHRKWDRMLRKYLSDWRLEQFPIPVHTITTDLISAQAIIRSSGDAVDSILESINLPILSPPIARDGMLLVDGGIVNNLPADQLVEQGCNFVIGVDVAANIGQQVGDNDCDTPESEMKVPGAVTTLLRCLRVQAHNMSGVGAEPADLIIAPDVSDFASTAFSRTPEMADIGEKSTRDAMPRIKDLLRKLDGQLFDVR